jgi:RimJ/RimL family protein N-acetyltransferase
MICAGILSLLLLNASHNNKQKRYTYHDRDCRAQVNAYPFESAPAARPQQVDGNGNWPKKQHGQLCRVDNRARQNFGISIACQCRAYSQANRNDSINSLLLREESGPNGPHCQKQVERDDEQRSLGFHGNYRNKLIGLGLKSDARVKRDQRRPLPMRTLGFEPAVSYDFAMHFDLQPHLQGELVALRPLTRNDWQAVYAVASDPLIWEQHPARDRWKEQEFREFFDDALKMGGAFAVIERASGKIIGSTQFRAFEGDVDAIEIGWTFLARSYWGGRYNHEMKRLMLEHAFKYVERVIFVVGEHNVRSQTAVQRIGGVRPAGAAGFVMKQNRHGQMVRNCKFVIEKPQL